MKEIVFPKFGINLNNKVKNEDLGVVCPIDDSISYKKFKDHIIKRFGYFMRNEIDFELTLAEFINWNNTNYDIKIAEFYFKYITIEGDETGICSIIDEDIV
jgi:hypothetical protein